MNGYLLDILGRRGWRRGGEVFWTLEDAKKAGTMMVKKRIVRQVRILPVDVALDSVADIGESSPNAKL